VSSDNPSRSSWQDKGNQDRLGRPGQSDALSAAAPLNKGDYCPAIAPIATASYHIRLDSAKNIESPAGPFSGG
jgi:hypothetical protein